MCFARTQKRRELKHGVTVKRLNSPALRIRVFHLAIGEIVILLTLSLRHIETPAKGRGWCSRMTVSTTASVTVR